MRPDRPPGRPPGVPRSKPPPGLSESRMGGLRIYSLPIDSNAVDQTPELVGAFSASCATALTIVAVRGDLIELSDGSGRPTSSTSRRGDSATAAENLFGREERMACEPLGGWQATGGRCAFTKGVRYGRVTPSDRCTVARCGPHGR